MADAKKRSLSELRVMDLKCELEKRGLDKTGVRAVLLKRLTKAVKDEGHNPESFAVDISGNDQKSPNKRASRSDSVVENDEPPIDVNVDDLLVQDEINEEDESAEKIDEEMPEAKLEGEANGNDNKANRKRENDDKEEIVAPKKPCVEMAPAQESAKKQAEQSNTDAEDSINLDIGDDELLNDETDATSRAKKDEGATSQPPEEEPPATDGDAAQSGGDAAPLSDRHDDDTPADAKKTSEPDETDKEKDKKDDKEDNDTSDSKNTEGNAGPNAASSSSSGQARNLWVSGLSGDTRAKDLKQLCSKHGKVIGAKVVTNARTPGSRCYGYVTMASAQDAESCIKNLHRTELHGRMISVEKAKSESSASASASGAPRDSSSSTWRRSGATRTYRHAGAHRRSASDGGGAGDGKERKEEKVKDEKGKEEMGKEEKGKEEGEEHTGEEGAETGDKEKGETEEGKDGASRDGERKPDEKSKQSSDRASRPGDKHADRPRRERSRGRRNSPRDVLSFSKIWKERDSARSRERVRAVREEERRRRAAEEDLRDRERRQRNEKHRLGLEREKLRQEREKIEREKNELLRLERERHKLEREKLELERLELKRAQIRLEEERSRGLKRSYEPTYERNARAERKAVSPPTYDRHKRSVPSAATAVSTSNSRQFEPPPPPRFELPTPAYERPAADKRERDYKRDYTTRLSSSVKYPSNGTASEDSRQPLPPGTRPKEQSRYVESERAGGRGESTRTSAGREGRGYRGASPGKGDSARSWGTAAPRYADAPAQAKGEYVERGSWHSNSKYSSSRHPAPSSAAPVSTHQTWGKPGGESWASSSGGEARYGGGGAAAGAAYDSRYAAPYQPPPPGAAPYVADTRYAPPASVRDYRKY